MIMVPWSNAIKKLKKRIGNKLLWLRASKHLQDDFLEFGTCIRSNTAHNINKIDGEVPEVVMLG